MGKLTGKTVLITSGPTREKIDPVRFITNRSTGKMGFEIGKLAVELGANVIFIHGHTLTGSILGARDILVESALDMFEEVKKNIEKCDIAIFCAAIADYRVKETYSDKLKAGLELTIELVRNPDIAKWCGENRKDGQLLVGFTAETRDLINTAKKKLENKKLDIIFANNVGTPGIGFESSNNEVIMVSKEKEDINSGLMDKSLIAEFIWNNILEYKE